MLGTAYLNSPGGHAYGHEDRRIVLIKAKWLVREAFGVSEKKSSGVAFGPLPGLTARPPVHVWRATGVPSMMQLARWVVVLLDHPLLAALLWVPSVGSGASNVDLVSKPI